MQGVLFRNTGVVYAREVVLGKEYVPVFEISKVVGTGQHVCRGSTGSGLAKRGLFLIGKGISRIKRIVKI